MIHNKYPRTYHLPYSPGSTNDDKKLQDGWFEYYRGKEIVITEKLDGSNISMSQNGVCERSTAVETRKPWARNLWDPQEGLYWRIKTLIGSNETLFGENLYGEHSIHYDKLPSYFHLFAVSTESVWESWESVKLFGAILGVKTVPELWRGFIHTEKQLEELVNKFVKEPSVYGDPREGVVVRLTSSFPLDDFKHCVCKWVRPNHVQTDEHWTKNWKKAIIYNS